MGRRKIPVNAFYKTTCCTDSWICLIFYNLRWNFRHLFYLICLLHFHPQKEECDTMSLLQTDLKSWTFSVVNHWVLQGHCDVELNYFICRQYWYFCIIALKIKINLVLASIQYKYLLQKPLLLYHLHHINKKRKVNREGGNISYL